MRVETWLEFICSIISYLPSQFHLRKCNRFYKLVIRDKICLNFTMTSHCLGAQISDFLSFWEREKIYQPHHYYSLPVVIQYHLSNWFSTLNNEYHQQDRTVGTGANPILYSGSAEPKCLLALSQSTVLPRIYWHWRGSGWIWCGQPAGGVKLITLNLVLHCSFCHGW